MKIKMELTEFEVIVLRAALAHYRTKPLSPKHEMAAADIEKKSRAQDDPLPALRRTVKR